MIPIKRIIFLFMRGVRSVACAVWFVILRHCQMTFGAATGHRAQAQAAPAGARRWAFAVCVWVSRVPCERPSDARKQKSLSGSAGIAF